MQGISNGTSQSSALGSVLFSEFIYQSVSSMSSSEDEVKILRTVKTKMDSEGSLKEVSKQGNRRVGQNIPDSYRY